MKELSIEQKAQKYNEALKAAVVAHKDEDKHLKATLERIFPELKESEGEKIKNQILYAIRQLPICEETKNKCIAWLEKQGEKPLEWKEENVDELSEFELAMMHIGGSFFGEKAGLDPNSTDDVNEQAELLLSLVPKQGWSEEDEKMYLSIMSVLLSTIGTDKAGFTVTREIDWLKSIKERYTWKPSDEQMEAMQKALVDLCGKDEHNIITGFYYDLKKLKG